MSVKKTAAGRRVLVVGAGSIGRRHMDNLRLMERDVRFDLLREDSRGRDESLASDETSSSSLDDALAKRPDLMLISNPSALHLRPLLAAIEHGIPFYAEKPVVATAEELATLKGVAGGALPPHIVGCNLRFLPSLLRLRELLERGAVGRIARARLEAGQYLPDWRPTRDYRTSYSARAVLGGGVLLDLIHEVDASLWLFGPFTDVRSLQEHASSLDIDCEDVACLLLGRAGGPVVTIELDYVSRSPVRNYTIVGDEGTLAWNLQQRTLVLQRTGEAEPFLLPQDAFDVVATYRHAMRELLDAIDEGRQTSQPLEQGIRALEVVMAARADAGRP